MATKRDPDEMTGAEFVRLREHTFGLTQAEMAAFLGLGLRTVIRFEAAANRKKPIPLCHAKHVRCKAREKKSGK
jgi:DNA-binding transcriptional regulator YiaG